MDKDRYLVKKSEKENHWVCADQHYKVVAVWEHGKFNETQDITMLEDFDPKHYMELAKVMRELGDYLAKNHREKI